MAAGLAWIEQSEPKGSTAKKSRKLTTTTADVRSFLSGQEKTALVDLIMDQAQTDERLAQHLLLKAARHGTRGVDLAAYRKIIDSAAHPGDFVDYRETYDYAEALDEVIDSIEELLKDGHASEVIELTEYALSTLERARESIDDSDGEVGAAFYRLQEFHLRACRKAKPDPETLARRLLDWELNSNWETFFGTR